MLIGARTGAWAASGAPLPYDAEVEYLESAGTQYIDTGIGLAFDTEIMLDVEWVSYQSGMFGSNAGSGAEVMLSRGGVDRHLLNGAFNADFGILTRRNVSIDLSSGAFKMTIDGNLVREATRPVYLTNRNILLFGSFDSTSTTALPAPRKWRLYSFAHKTGGEFDLEMIPVRKDGVGYMYDRVSGQLFGNAGTGAFVIGPDK